MESVVKIGIKKIKEIASEIIEVKGVNFESLNLSFDINLNIVPEENYLDFIIIFSVSNSESNTRVIFIKVLNRFTIEDLHSFKSNEEGKYNIPDNALITMLSLSISHTRALLSNNLSGTEFEKFYIPIMDPTEMARHFFKIGQETEA